MRRYWAYFNYILRHKYYVLRACKYVECSIWRGLVHDMSKFMPCEFISYAKTFYKPDGSKQYVKSIQFDLSWLHHQHTNKHHWQYWLLKEDSGKIVPLPMDIKYLREMVADWIGAGLAINGKLDIEDWYEKNKDKILLHSADRYIVEYYIKCLRWE